MTSGLPNKILTYIDIWLLNIGHIVFMLHPFKLPRGGVTPVPVGTGFVPFLGYFFHQKFRIYGYQFWEISWFIGMLSGNSQIVYLTYLNNVIPFLLFVKSHQKVTTSPSTSGFMCVLCFSFPDLWPSQRRCCGAVVYPPTLKSEQSGGALVRLHHWKQNCHKYDTATSFFIPMRIWFWQISMRVHEKNDL